MNSFLKNVFYISFFALILVLVASSIPANNDTHIDKRTLRPLFPTPQDYPPTLYRNVGKGISLLENAYPQAELILVQASAMGYSTNERDFTDISVVMMSGPDKIVAIESIPNQWTHWHQPFEIQEAEISEYQNLYTPFEWDDFNMPFEVANSLAMNARAQQQKKRWPDEDLDFKVLSFPCQIIGFERVRATSAQKPPEITVKLSGRFNNRQKRQASDPLRTWKNGPPPSIGESVEFQSAVVGTESRRIILVEYGFWLFEQDRTRKNYKKLRSLSQSPYVWFFP